MADTHQEVAEEVSRQAVDSHLLVQASVEAQAASAEASVEAQEDSVEAQEAEVCSDLTRIFLFVNFKVRDKMRKKKLKEDCVKTITKKIKSESIEMKC